MQKKNEKRFFLSEIITSELVSLNCPYEEQDIFRQQPPVTKRDFFKLNFFFCDRSI